MEQRDYIIIGLIALLVFQQCEIWQIKKDRFCSKLAALSLIRWMDEVHHIKAPEPEKDKRFAQIILDFKNNDFVKKELND
jgi:hypothetical protein